MDHGSLMMVPALEPLVAGVSHNFGMQHSWNPTRKRLLYFLSKGIYEYIYIYLFMGFVWSFLASFHTLASSPKHRYSNSHLLDYWHFLDPWIPKNPPVRSHYHRTFGFWNARNARTFRDLEKKKKRGLHELVLWENSGVRISTLELIQSWFNLIPSSWFFMRGNPSGFPNPLHHAEKRSLFLPTCRFWCFIWWKKVARCRRRTCDTTSNLLSSQTILYELQICQQSTQIFWSFSDASREVCYQKSARQIDHPYYIKDLSRALWLMYYIHISPSNVVLIFFLVQQPTGRPPLHGFEIRSLDCDWSSRCKERVPQCLHHPGRPRGKKKTNNPTAVGVFF